MLAVESAALRGKRRDGITRTFDFKTLADDFPGRGLLRVHSALRQPDPWRVRRMPDRGGLLGEMESSRRDQSERDATGDDMRRPDRALTGFWIHCRQ